MRARSIDARAHEGMSGKTHVERFARARARRARARERTNRARTTGKTDSGKASREFDDGNAREMRTRREMEEMYAEAKAAYYAGAPVVSDDAFDELEGKLYFMNSQAVKKYPRCSVREKAVYSDCVTDEAQMRALETSYVTILVVGAAFLCIDFGDDARALLSLVFSIPDAPKLRIPILGALGIGLAMRGVEKLRSAKNGETLAMTGECPACREQVYAFLPARRMQAKERAECHCCGRKIVFDAQFERRESSPWKVVGKGRIYLVSERSDYDFNAE